MHSVNSDKLIGQVLIEAKVVTAASLEKALASQVESGGFICSILADLGLASVNNIFGALAKHIGLDFIDIKNISVMPSAVEKVPAKIVLHYRLMPYALVGNSLKIVLADPLDVSRLDDLRLILGFDVEPALGYEKDILEMIAKYYGVGANIIEDIIAASSDKTRASVSKQVVENIESSVEDASIIKFVNHVFSQAVAERASDIHMEPFERELRLRFRIDGFLYDIPIPDNLKIFQHAIVSRVKIMAGLDIAERRLPQDGRIRIATNTGEIDLRVSILPSSFGESLHIRILGRSAFIDLERLGLMPDDMRTLENIVSKPHGVVFVTGPTGSGKSTTLTQL